MIRVSFALLILVTSSWATEMNWPQFRGPRGDGTTLSTKLPLTWSETSNVVWRTSIHGRAWSSPVIWGNHIWLTTATQNGQELFVVCFDKESGEIRRDQRIFTVEKPQFCHPFNTYASPTPVVEQGRVFVTFGAPGTACLDAATGEKIWERRDLECNHFRGAGSSPIIHQNLLIVNMDGSDFQYVVALDKHTGRTVWRKNRSIDFQDLGRDGKPEAEGDMRKAFATCHVASFDADPILISPGSKAVYAYEPLTGVELWRVEERTSYSAATRPVVGHGLIFVPSGFATGQLLAIRPGAKGEILDAKDPPKSEATLAVNWRVKKGVPKKPSLLLAGDLLFAIEDNGIASCWEAKTGDVLWSERLGGRFSASPLGAGHRIYFFSEEGKTTVIEAGRAFKKLAESSLPDGFMASPAVSGDALFVRTEKDLYRIETRQ